MIGLALAGGGVKGSYEVGAYDAMKKCHIKIDGVTGTSIGAFNAVMIACNKSSELTKFWHSIDVASILGITQDFSDAVNSKTKDIDFLKLSFKEAIRMFKNHGFNVEGLEDVLKKYNVAESIKHSNMDFGICTYKINNHEAIEIFKEGMHDKVNDYVIASCYLPIFKPKKIIDDSYYFDGGIHDNCPANMLLKKGYDLVYRIELNSIGRKVKLLDPKKVITISPSRKLSPIITVNKEQINENYWIGYYDALKVIKKYPGKDYLFKKRSYSYYKFITRKVPNKVMNNMKKKFNAQNEKDLLIKVFEYLMKKDKLSYYKIYSMSSLIKKYHNNNDKQTSEFTRHLCVFL